MEVNQFNIHNYLTKESDLNAYSEFLYNITSQEPNNIQNFVECFFHFQQYLYYQSTQKSQLNYLLFNYSTSILFNQYKLSKSSPNYNEIMKYLVLSPKFEAKNVGQNIVDLLEKHSINITIKLPIIDIQNQPKIIDIFAQMFYLHALSSDDVKRYFNFIILFYSLNFIIDFILNLDKMKLYHHFFQIYF